ncbi:MAG: type IV toxin-antitoxin system AbiEi family antitoxin domain-containing protein [Phycisphaerae bacterium]|nr:type IV toxin-antitoxin system AbiEi family antitoxin domain-containing protein [Phycisphaerae bacterium]
MFHGHGGLLRTKDEIWLGIHPRTLYSMRDAGELEQVGRGHYRLTDLPQLGNPDLIAVALAVPKGVLCLISALSYHGIGTQIPRTVDIAIEKDIKRPRIDYPPIRTFWFSGPAFTEGVQTHDVDGVPVRIYSPAKTVADCFKCRNKVGLDVALEALREVRRNRLATIDEIFQMAKVCRVANVMRPYLAVLATRTLLHSWASLFTRGRSIPNSTMCSVRRLSNLPARSPTPSRWSAKSTSV